MSIDISWRTSSGLLCITYKVLSFSGIYHGSLLLKQQSDPQGVTIKTGLFSARYSFLNRHAATTSGVATMGGGIWGIYNDIRGVATRGGGIWGIYNPEISPS